MTENFAPETAGNLSNLEFDSEGQLIDQKPEPKNAETNQHGKRDSTVELPMFELEEVLRFVSQIHEKGVETAKMPEVAVACGYKHASSTPFYRRITASRLFGLLASSGAELSLRARDYIQPTSEDSKSRALAEACASVPFYGEQLAKHTGKKLNTELVANDIVRNFNLTHGAARICARAFEQSIRFAGLLSSENIVLPSPSSGGGDQKRNSDADGLEEPDSDTQRHTLFLDRHKKRKFSFVAPVAISRADYVRICKWLEVAMIVDSDSQEPKSEGPQT